jgi:hypothetical protein
VARYSTLDKLLLLVWLPIVVFLLALHMREVVRTGLAQPPVFATPPGEDGYPRVGGFPLEVETRAQARGGRQADLGRRRRPEGRATSAMGSRSRSKISRASLVFGDGALRGRRSDAALRGAVAARRFLVMWTFVAALLLPRSPRTPSCATGPSPAA